MAQCVSCLEYGRFLIFNIAEMREAFVDEVREIVLDDEEKASGSFVQLFADETGVGWLELVVDKGQESVEDVGKWFPSLVKRTIMMR